MADESWDIPGLRARCLRMRDTASVRSLASPDELTACWPGGENNPRRDKGGWIVAYGQLCKFIGRRERLAGEDTLKERTQVMLLRGSPHAVALITPIDGQPPTLHVHPKSYDTLVTLAEMERTVREMAAWRSLLETQPEALEVTNALGFLARSLARLHATFVWIVTHPGPGVPYAASFALPWDLDELPPAWCSLVDPYDLLRLAHAHTEVNLGRLRMLPTLERATDRGAGWATFFVNVAEATKTPVAELTGGRALASLMAHSALVADSYRRAEAERAKGKAA